jgi:hypothetical protein
MSRIRRFAVSGVLLGFLVASTLAYADDLVSSGFGLRDFRDLGDQPNKQAGTIDISFLIDLATASVASCELFAGTYDQGGNPQAGEPLGLAGITAKMKWEVVGMACPNQDFGDCKKTKRLAAGKVNFATQGAPNLGESQVAHPGINFAKVETNLPDGCCPYFLASNKGKGLVAVGQVKVYCEVTN